MKYEYKLSELAAIINKSQALVSLKLQGKVSWTVDEIQAMYEVLGDEAWLIYENSKKRK